MTLAQDSPNATAAQFQADKHYIICPGDDKAYGPFNGSTEALQWASDNKMYCPRVRDGKYLSFQGDREIVNPYKPESENVLETAIADINADSLNWQRIDTDIPYRCAIITRLMNLAKPQLGQQRINSQFAYGYCDSEMGNSSGDF